MMKREPIGCGATRSGLGHPSKGAGLGAGVAAAAFAVIGSLATSPAWAKSPPTVDLLLKPHSSGARVDYVDVRMKVQAPAAKAGAPFLLQPQKLGHIDGPEYDPSSLKIVDAKGRVPFTRNGYKPIRLKRATSGDVAITFRSAANIVNRPPFPPYDLRSEGQSAIGVGYGFLLEPKIAGVHRLRLRWDLAGMPAGSFGVWSFGEGQVERVGPIHDLIESAYGVGPLRHHSNGPFGLYWASDAPFDAEEMGRDGDRLFQYYTKFFSEQPSSYRAFLRYNAKGGSAGALIQSFLFDYNAAKVDLGSLKNTLAHEMAHTFIGHWQDKNWYGEGMANHYAGVLGVRSGTSTPDEFLSELNKDAKMYYDNPARDMTVADAEAAGFGADFAAADLFYGRGRLYLSSVNAKILARSGGKRSLDNVTLALLARVKAGLPAGEPQWLALVEAELGTAARKDHAEFLAGKLIVPASDTFGPCFRRETRQIGRFDLGFDRSLLFKLPAVIKAVRAGSPGERAGLRPGDRIVKADTSATNRNLEGEVKLSVRRGGETIDVHYVPRGDQTIETYRWVRQAGTPDAACRI